ncbi:hypothetical protein Dsin_033186 [Dipteronia sinensis]|uniref:Eukaryotic translation initiation factor 2A n=1 Tax=Dipteronia sinensis TaxID=43782 RepID=A0AAD9ZF98_9ROSI|nr:hypothetical protein Dsin_033186 [Dipteronia sinensis]
MEFMFAEISFAGHIGGLTIQIAVRERINGWRICIPHRHLLGLKTCGSAKCSALYDAVTTVLTGLLPRGVMSETFLNVLYLILCTRPPSHPSSPVLLVTVQFDHISAIADIDLSSTDQIVTRRCCLLLYIKNHLETYPVFEHPEAARRELLTQTIASHLTYFISVASIVGRKDLNIDTACSSTNHFIDRPAANSSARVNVISADNGNIISTLPTENVYELGFSPLGTYIITWQRPSKDENGDGVKNLKVWRVEQPHTSEADMQTVGKFVQSSQTGWNLQYTYDEKFCARVVTNEVQIYESHDLTKGQPAAVRVYNVPNFTSPISQKNFFKGDKVEMKWNDNGTSLIVLAQTEVDKSGKSYYGETTLYLLSANGGFDSRIDLDKDGPIHDVTWSPKSTSFAVVYGYMPAKTVVFNTRAQVVFTFPLGPRNTVSYSPHGRFMFVAGFGNLAGEMDIYDLEKDYAKVCQINASNAVIHDWSPDGKHILTATTTPRLRVDNGIRIWHASGQLMYNEDMNELYNVQWRPQHPSMFPIEANPFQQVPAPHPSVEQYTATKKTPSKPVGAYRPPGARGTATPLAFMREDKGGVAFIRESPSAFGSQINGFGKPRARVVPGAESAEDKASPTSGAAPGGGVSLAGTGEAVDGEPMSKNAKKNAKKREAKKAAAAAAKDGEVPAVTEQTNQIHVERKGPAPAAPPGLAPPTGPRSSRSRSGSRRQTQSTPQTNGAPPRTPASQTGSAPINSSMPAPTPAPPVPAPVSIPTPASTPVPAPVEEPVTPGGQDKKVRGLLKKIRAIEDLKMRLAGGEKLEDTQMKKIQSEESVRKELAMSGHSTTD